MLKLLSFIGLVFVFSSLIISFTITLMVKLDLKLTLTKKQWIFTILMLAIFHSVFRVVLPHLIFPVAFCLVSVIVFTILYKLKIKKILWAIVKYFIITLIVEVTFMIICSLFKFHFESATLDFHTLIYSLPILALEILVISFIYRKEITKWFGFCWESRVRRAASK